MRRLQHVVARPDPRHESADWLTDTEGTALLMGTPVGSRAVQKNGELGDTGTRAQIAANRLGMLVVAYQNPGPATSFLGVPAARWRLGPKHFGPYMDEFAGQLGDMLQEEGISNAMVRPHSGDGPFGVRLTLALPQVGDIGVSHLGTTDIVGLLKLSPGAGRQLMRAHGATIQHTPPEQRTPAGHPSNHRLDYLTDVAVRAGLWRSDTARADLVTIGNTMPDTAVLLQVPGYSIYGPQAENIYNGIAAEVNRPPGAAPFVVKRDTDSYHSGAHDNHDRNVAFVQELREMTHPNPNQP